MDNQTSPSPPPAPSQPIAPRRAWKAGVLSVLVPGLGHLYAGRPVRGASALLILIVIVVVFFQFAMVMASPVLRIGFIAAGFVAFVLVVIDAVRQARSAPVDYRLRAYNRWYVYVAAYVVSMIGSPTLIETLSSRVGTTYAVGGESMVPTLHQGEFIFTAPVRGELVARGSAAVLRDDQFGAVVTRVIGGPGDVIQMNAGRVYINGAPAAEPYALDGSDTVDWHDPSMLWQRDYLADAAAAEAYHPTVNNWGPLRIPDGLYFVMGDNRAFSFDSRMRGFIGREQIIGRPVWIYFSRDPDERRMRWDRIGRSVDAFKEQSALRGDGR